MKGLPVLIAALLFARSLSASSLPEQVPGSSRALLFPAAPLASLPHSAVTASGATAPILAWTVLPGGGRLAVLGPLAERSGGVELLGPVAFGGVVPEAPPSSFPDLTQTDRSLALPLGGWIHCGPAAASNVLEALGLVEDGSAVVAALGSGAYMDTRFSLGGTSPSSFLEGLDRFLRDRSLEGLALEYQGWSSRPFRYGLVPAPCWDDIGLALATGGGAVLQVGWYVRRGGEWRRRGGHWVTLAGFDDGAWAVADPGPWAGRKPQLQAIRLGPLPEGTVLLAGGNRMDGKAFHQVLTGLARPRQGEAAVAEGVVLFWRRLKELDWGR